MAQLSLHLARSKSAGLAPYRWLGGIHTQTHAHVDTYTHMGCMKTRDTMTVRFDELSYLVNAPFQKLSA